MILLKQGNSIERKGFQRLHVKNIQLQKGLN